MKEHYVLIIFMVSFLLLAFITAQIEVYFDNKKKKKNDRIQTHNVRPRNNGGKK